MAADVDCYWRGYCASTAAARRCFRSVGCLFGLSNVERRFVELGVAREVVIPGLQPAPCVFCGPKKPTGREWKAENVTLLTALNRIAASYGNVRWVYEERTCGTRVSRVWAN